MYDELTKGEPKVSWRSLMYGNVARPRALIIMWLTCHGRLAVKNRLHSFGMMNDTYCCLCGQVENLNHLFFKCAEMRNIWCSVLDWLHLNHQPIEWKEELQWIVHGSKGKGWRVSLLKLATTEVVHGLWKCKNDKVFGNTVDNEKIGKQIIENIVYRRDIVEY